VLNRRLSLAGSVAQLSLIGYLCCSAVSHWLLPVEQRKTHGYNNVEIRDFSASWQSGLGMEFLPHIFLPIVQFKNLAVFRNRFRWASGSGSVFRQTKSLFPPPQKNEEISCVKNFRLGWRLLVEVLFKGYKKHMTFL
jgi:hypothetical protein